MRIDPTGVSRTVQTEGTIPPVVASEYPDRHGPWAWQGMKLRTKLFLGYLVFIIYTNQAAAMTLFERAMAYFPTAKH